MICPDYSNFRAVFATSASVDPDGYQEWPVAEVRANSIPSITGFPFPVTSFEFTLTIDDGAAGIPEYNTYLEQRTDVGARQWIEYTETSGCSGSWDFVLTTTCVNELGLASAAAMPTVDQLLRIVKHVTFYVQRQSDDAIQLLKFDQAAFGYEQPPTYVAP